MPVEDYLPEWQGLWDASGHDPKIFFSALLTVDKIDRELYDHEMRFLGIEPPPEEEPLIPVVDIGELTITEAVHRSFADYIKVGFSEFFKGFWTGVRGEMTRQIKFTIDVTKPLVVDAWGFFTDKVTALSTILFEGIHAAFAGHSPIQPEDAEAIARNLYNFCIQQGMLAHAAAIGAEVVHPLKNLGLGQIPGMIGEFSGFGRISAASIGPLVNRVLGQAMTYAVQDRYRPVIPRESLLIELRSKREIGKPAFDKAMAYQGFSNDWIDAIERWQWKDPRMFELMRVADVGIDQGPPPASEKWWFDQVGVTGDKLKDWWLYRKLMRAGYEDVDLPVLIRTIHRRQVSFAMTYVRTAIRRNYRWGYLTEKELGQWIDKLQLPEQAKTWILWAGQLDREYFYRQDLVGFYKLAYRNDLLDSDELLVALLAMGLPAREADIITRTEQVRKSPKVSRPVAQAAKKAASDIQKKSITLYLQQYRKDLISSEQLLESLLSIGLAPELAEISVDLELAKKGVLPSAELS